MYKRIILVVLLITLILLSITVMAYKYFPYYQTLIATRTSEDETHCKYVSTLGLKKCV